MNPAAVVTNVGDLKKGVDVISFGIGIDFDFDFGPSRRGNDQFDSILSAP